MAKADLIAEPGTHEIIMTRTFNAPRDLLFKAMTDPDLVPQWWGQRANSTTVARLEARDGGSWRFVQNDAHGNEFGFHGVYHSVSLDKIIDTFEWEGLPGHVILETMTLEETENGQTTLTVSSVFQSVVDRDGMLMSGMEGGSNESYDRLDELLEKMYASKA
ncbi:MAG: SRPBCC family protein [Chloroflexi bacterium]|nr:SRPBCC family protein [Chloroflexota bacterium]OJW06119.1 MAG: ATPase [Chloroflexi bacterium 54-19]